MNKLRIYVHIPFCESKCCYCDFASFVATDDVKKRYFAKLLKDISEFDCGQKIVSSIYFGGGTPSSVEEKYIEKILSLLKKKFTLDQDAEITIECNPASSMLEKLKRYREMGINRISFGVQSLDDDTLKFLNRRHDAETALKALKDAQKAGFENISADLMIGVNADVDKLLGDAQKLIESGVKHISAYMLQIEENTPLFEMIKNGQSVPIATDDECILLYEKLVHFLAEKGFCQYEVSSFSKSGYQSRHNLGYWTGDEYVGFGLAAHSYLNGVRFFNSKCMQEYLNNQNITKEVLTDKQKIEESIMLGLRCQEGVSLPKLKNLGYELEGNKNYFDLLKNGYIVKKGEKIYLNPKFYSVNNMIIVKLLPEI